MTDTSALSRWAAARPDGQPLRGGVPACRPGRLMVGAPWVLIIALLLASTATALAQEPPRERQLVYGLNMFDGITYQSGFVPRQVDTIYAMADADSVIDPKLTEVYFWPITNEYRPDFTALNQLVPGTLEISQGGRLVRSVELAPYVVQFDQAAKLAAGHVYLGDDGSRAWASFQAARAAYLDRLRQYTDASQAFDQKLADLRKQGGGTPPEPPPQPEPFTLYSTEPGQGFPLRLTSGEYAIHIRDAAGQLVPGSEKRLVAIAPRRRGYGYEVVPQEKWTYPEVANDPSNAIYTVPGGVLYLRPFAEIELNALEYARLRNPQDLQATANRWTWVHTAEVADAALVVRGSAETQFTLDRFKVEQLPGGALGYRVAPFDATKGGSPDLVAYRVAAPLGRGAVGVALLDPAGRELPGSVREVRVNSTVADWQLALPVVVPLALGLTVALWRREQVKSARGLGPEQRHLIA